MLFAARSVTLFGSQVSEVALLVQVKRLTGSAAAVGLLGAAELLPLLLFGLYGGVLADRLDRRRVALATEAALAAVLAGLAVNAALPHPLLWPLYAAAAAIMALAALQRPSLDAALPRVVAPGRLAAAAALFGLTYNASAVIGPALGGLLATGPGPLPAYALDAATFAVSALLLLRIRPLPPPAPAAASPGPAGAPPPGTAAAPVADDPGAVAAPGTPGGGRAGLIRGTAEALRYVGGRPELLGSYLADLAAMIFAVPYALFPFAADALGASWSAGPMYSAVAAGAVLASATSGWTGRVRRYGRAIALGAAAWGAALAVFGLAPNVWAALGCLVAAGAADMISGLFRTTLWNLTSPDALRGRLAGLELISYGAGEPLGRLRSGAVAGVIGPAASLWTGGLACVAAVAACCAALPRFWTYTIEPGTSAGPSTGRGAR